MNNLLHLTGRFEQKRGTSRPGPPQLPVNTSVSKEKLEQIISDLKHMQSFWESQDLLEGALVSVYYTKIAAKSNRVSKLLSEGSKHPNTTIVGARFSNDNLKHIITHNISRKAIEESILNVEKTLNVLENEFQGLVSDEVFNDAQTYNGIDFSRYEIYKSNFQKIIVDCNYVEKIDVNYNTFEIKNSALVTLYKTGENIQELLSSIGITIYNEKMMNDTTILLDPHYMKLLYERAPYLVAMATENISELNPCDFKFHEAENRISIPSPTIEPTIGVIDTLFDDSVYFSEWVEYEKRVDDSIPIEPGDYKHGTAVTSIIVDGPQLNPDLDDGCGRFKVRHFGVATKHGFNSFSIIKSIKEIIASNRDIKVWNLSLGSNEEINNNFISAEAAVLDEIQYENDVIFIVAGTNKNVSEPEKRIGSPADSINSIVVNSVDRNREPNQYSRKGTVLSFFTKPDVSYYGGSRGDYISVCEPLGKAEVSGTSFAAPWIARKMSFMIDILGMEKEVAKALLIDSAIEWNTEENHEKLQLVGHGIVPIRIEDIVTSPKDEIKFFVTGTSIEYETFNYNFPLPINKGKYPFYARATLCYFPKCSRSQGVDYTNTELDIYFGRIDDKGKLVSINGNKQSLDMPDIFITEESARKMFRKWDNIKHISDRITPNPKPRKVYTNSMWGMSVKTKERLNNGDGKGIKFGVVVTFKEMYGVNRIDDFIQQCSLRGWLVNRIDVENKIDIYQIANEEIDLE